MSDLYNKIVEQRGSFENLVAKIPGFKGYQEKQARRKADTMLREHIAGEVKKLVNRFTQIERTILDNGGLAHMSKTREVKSKVQSYAERIAAEMPGYSGMWASIKIGDEELERLYAFDEAQIRYVNQLEDAIDKVETAAKGNDGLAEALDEVYNIAVEASDAFQLRDDVLLDLSKSL